MTTVPLGWLRGFAAFLAVPNLVTGVWAVSSPRGFFDDFPGLGPALVSAEPPYNMHLITDAGAGFLAVGGALALAAAFGGVGELRLALGVLVLFAAPHTTYHVLHPASGLEAGANLFSDLALGAQVLLPIVLILLSRAWKEDHGLQPGA